MSRAKEDRHPSAFTGFDAADDMPFERLRDVGRPLHVVNSTLNLVADNALAVAERKATSFTMSPLHAGSRHLGYRPAATYASGITLGEALTTSGAAVSSNMGPDASRAMTFLLTVFNARLGVWLGNPGVRGDDTWRRAAPAFGVAPLVSELLARTTYTNPYVLLSDGGHFENLGLYEMVFRRCRFIVLSDAGCDGGYSFGDLANAVRKIRIDFGVAIDFPGGLTSPRRTQKRRVRAVRRCASPSARLAIRRSIPRSRTASSCTSNRRSSATSPSMSRTTPARMPRFLTSRRPSSGSTRRNSRAIGCSACRRLRRCVEASSSIVFGICASLCAKDTYDDTESVDRRRDFLAGVIGGWMLAAGRGADIRQAAPLPASLRAAGQNGLTDADRANFYHLSEGGELFPLDWLLALDVEVPASDGSVHVRRFLDNIERFGFLPDGRHEGNPYGLPVGVSLGRAKLNGDEMIGLNCSACHVGQVQYQHNAVRVDGAGNMAYVNKFLEHMASETEATMKSPSRLARFWERVRAVRRERQRPPPRVTKTTSRKMRHSPGA